MKHFILSCLAAAFLLTACNSNKSKETTNDDAAKEKTEAERSSDNMSTKSADDVQARLEEMRKLPALSTDQIKAMLPQELAGMKRSSFSANSAMGYGIGEAKYKSEDGEKSMKLVVYDCVGDAGAGLYTMMFWGWNMEREDENGYEKTTTFDGGKAIEKYQKSQDEYSLTFPASNRLLVHIEGEKTGLDALKQAASSLNLKTN
ncbi:MAG TPA: hypothetical protein VI461_01785 [Chitinophagaceae bacterium]|nr:hypothetical protein [Chitinophagaceae bacterium]